MTTLTKRKIIALTLMTCSLIVIGWKTHWIVPIALWAWSTGNNIERRYLDGD